MGQSGGHEDEGAELELSNPPVDVSSGAEQAPLLLEKPVLEFGRPLDAPRRRRNVSPVSAPVDEDRVGDYRHPDASRTNIPEAGVATQDRAVVEKSHFEYRQGDLPPFDPHEDPQLIWAGKAEHTSFDVDTVSLHIHERVSTAAILRAVRREEVQRTLFSDPQFSLDQELAFYQHEMDWANRLILGDSLLVMNSLLRREGMAGKVQCIYIDPPYGVNYNSNFQPRTDQRDVRDGDDRSLTREPEQIRAYRDTWQLGIHSYLTYLRDRLLLARDLLTDSGSVFVQISNENVHRVMATMDEVFGSDNFVALIAFRKTAGASSPVARTNVLATISDYLVWYARDLGQIKYRSLFEEKPPPEEASGYPFVELRDGTRGPSPDTIPPEARLYRHADLTSQGYSPTLTFAYEFEGRSYHPGANRHWATTRDGLDGLTRAGRLGVSGSTLRFLRYLDDFPVFPRTNVWNDTGTGSFTDRKTYVVQTGSKVIARVRPHDHGSRRPRVRPDLRLRDHRLRRRAVGPSLDHLRHQPGRARAGATATDDRQLRVLPAGRPGPGRRRRLPLPDRAPRHASEHCPGRAGGDGDALRPAAARPLEDARRRPVHRRADSVLWDRSYRSRAVRAGNPGRG